ncbi:MAG TPA: CoA-binding protein [Chitinophagales bacterium]|nr:CoA-binding protein [Chitinophagales bacterium]
MAKTTLVIGASVHPWRYAYLAVNRLRLSGHPVIPLGIEKGSINGMEIETERKNFKDIDTVTLYINPSIQKEYYDYLLNVIQPRRIIFNPGTENQELKMLAEKKGIETVEACTLVMLASGQY